MMCYCSQNKRNGYKISTHPTHPCYSTCQSYMVLVTQTTYYVYHCYCPYIASRSFKLCLLSRLFFLLIVRKQETVFLRIVCALVII